MYLRNSYRMKHFPTLTQSNSPTTSVHHEVGLPLSPDVTIAGRSATLPSPYRNKYEVPNMQVDSPVGLYNCPQQRTSQAFSSMDDLDALTANSVHLHPSHPPQPVNALSPVSVGSRHSPHRLTPTRSSYVNHHLMSHSHVLSQAQAVISRAEAATAAAMSTQQQHIQTNFKANSLERSTSNASVRTNKLAAPGVGGNFQLPNKVNPTLRELPALPNASSSKSMEDLDALETFGVHGRTKYQYREVLDSNGPLADGLSQLSSTSSLVNSARSHHLPNTEEYPTHHHPSSTISSKSSLNRSSVVSGYHHPSGGLRGLAAMSAAAVAVMDNGHVHSHAHRDAGGPYPSSLATHSSTLLPGQTYPEPPLSQPLHPSMNTLQEVFYHREMRLAASGSIGGAGAAVGLPNRSSSISSNTSVARKHDVPPVPPPKNKDNKKPGDESPPPPLYPKQYHQVVELRRRSGLDRPTATAVPPKQVIEQSPVVDRKIKPSNSLNTSKEIPHDSSISGDISTSSQNDTSGSNLQPKYLPYRETTKPFEMSDFYKYSTKFRKTSTSSLPRSDSSSINGAAGPADADSDSSPRSSTASAGSNPPELPARPSSILTPQGSISGSPAKNGPLPPPPPPKSDVSKKFISGNGNVMNNNEKDVGDSFSTEMLDWYNKKQSNQNNPSKSANTSNNSKASSSRTDDNSNKPATLV